MATSTLRSPQAANRIAVLASADLSFRQRVRDVLTGLRWQVREASGGAEALAHLDSGPAETLVLDSWLPDLEIQEFISEFQKLHPTVDLVTVDDFPPRQNVVRSPRRNEILFALRRSQEASHTSPPTPPAPASDKRILTEANHTIGPAIPALNKSCRLPEFIGEHPSMLKVSHRIRLVAPHRTPVLVEGPTGTGKELVARALHRLSPRSARPFSLSTAPPFRRRCSKPSSSATPGERSPERCREELEGSRPRRAEPSSSTKSERCRSRFNPSSCASSKAGSSSGLARTIP